MNKKDSIVLKSPYIERSEGVSYLRCPIEIPNYTAEKWMEFAHVTPGDYRLYEDFPPQIWGNKDFSLWFSVATTAEDALVIDRADSFVVAILIYSMATGADIYSEAGVTKDLLEKINNVLIPALCNEHTGFKAVKVYAEGVEPIVTRGYRVTGMSCGVDSLYTLFVERKNLTHLVYFNVGAVYRTSMADRHISLSEFNEYVKKICMEKSENARRVAVEENLEFMYIDSNIDLDIYRGGYNCSCDYRNVAAILATGNYWEEYILADAGFMDAAPESNEMSIHNDPALYLSFLLKTIETSYCKMTRGGFCNRLSKIKTIADYQIAHKYLDVCYKNSNCGTCVKCVRTMVMLESIGKLDLFNESLNLPIYKKYNTQIMGSVVFYYLKKRDKYCILPIAKELKKVTLKAWIYGIAQYIARTIYDILYNIAPNINKTGAFRFAINLFKQ